MRGRDDVDACAIRVMLADDHRATLCGIAVMLDAPFTVDWLRRMEQRGGMQGRPGGHEGEEGAAAPVRGTRARRSSNSSRDDARLAASPVVSPERAAVTLASASLQEMTPRLSSVPGPPPTGQSDAALTATASWSPGAIPTLGARPTMNDPVSTVTTVAALSSLEGKSTAVWHPTSESLTVPRRNLGSRRGTAMRSIEEEDDQDREFAPDGLLSGIDYAVGGPSQGALGRMRVRDGIPITERDSPRSGADCAALAGVNVKGRVRGQSYADDGALANVVVTGAFSHSADLFEALSTTPCDVLVCDLAMGDGPHGDGLTMIGYLRRHYPCVKLIVHTMCLHACVLRNLQLLRVQGIVSKMDDLALIRRAVWVVQKGGIYHGPSIAAALEQAGYQETDTDRPAVWSKREAEVIRRFVNGDPVKEIAQALNRSVKTVSTQKMSAMHKAGINSNAELYQYAAANGLLLVPGVASSDAWQWCEGFTTKEAKPTSPMQSCDTPLPDTPPPITVGECVRVSQ